jgi:GTP pyrophosphokinase
MEDLSFRFLEPETYRQVARLLDEKRTEREASVAALRQKLASDLAVQGIVATVQGRPKHIYSIVKKMRGKSLLFDQVYDIRALRIVVPGVPDCYAALSWVHSQFVPVADEFDDYIARPKGNGYQSLHTVVRDENGQPIEVQVRTQAMHDHAEHGVAAHWAYKEAGTKGYAGVSASGEYDVTAVSRPNATSMMPRYAAMRLPGWVAGWVVAGVAAVVAAGVAADLFAGVFAG